MVRFARCAVVALLIVVAGCSRDPVAQSQRLVDSGNRFFTKGKYKEASIMFRRALQKNPKNGEAYYRLGLTSLRLGEGTEAAGALRRAMTTPPVNPDAAVKLGDLYWLAYVYKPAGNQQRLADIQQISDDMLKKDPNSFDGLRFAGYVAAANKDTATALKDFEAANRVKPYDPGVSLAYFGALIGAKRTDDAEKLAKDVLAHQKNNGSMYTQLVGLYMAQKRLGDAEQTLKLQAENNPHAEAPLVQLAAFYLATQRRADMENTLQKIVSNTKDFPAGRATTGGFFARIREYDRARQEFDLGIKVDPKNKALYQKATVEILALQGKTQEASQLINDVLKESPKDSQAIAMRSALLLKGGSPEQIRMALADLQGLVAKSPDNAVSRFQLGQALLASHQNEAARIQLEEAIKLKPGMVPPRVLLAQLYSLNRDYSRALAAADEILTKLDPGNYQAHLIRSSALMGLGKRDEARAELTKILKAAPNSADAEYQLGFLSFQEQNFKEAEAIFKQMQTSAPGDPRGLIGVVETEVAQGNYAEAISLLRAQMQKDPNRVDYRTALANVLVRDKQYDAAIQEFQQVAAKTPKNSEIFTKLGEVYRLKGDINAAVDNFRKGKALAAPNDSRPATRLALLLDGMGRRDEAKPLYEEILRIDPNNVAALNNLAYIKAEEGTDLDTALSLAQRARQIDPRNPNIADTLGWVYIKKNLSDDAIRIYKEVVAMDAKNASYHYHLAMALFQKGDRQGAKQSLELALKNGPNPSDQQKIRELMNKVGA